jgi:hypothetical protein
MDTQFWLQDPSILFKNDSITELWPSDEMSSNEKLNAVTRTVIILTVFGYFLNRSMKIIVTGVITLAIVILMQRIKMTKKIKKTEGFANPRLYEFAKKDFTEPTQQNPAMNVLLTERKDNPNREAAAPAYNKNIEEKMNNDTQKFVASTFDDPNIDEKLFKDLGDNFNFDQSMRSWYATPNTQIPNDQHAFAEWCYGDMVSCKQGSELACSRSGPPRWTNN